MDARPEPRPPAPPSAADAVRRAHELLRPAPQPPEERYRTIFRDVDPGGFRMM